MLFHRFLHGRGLGRIGWWQRGERCCDHPGTLRKGSCAAGAGADDLAFDPATARLQSLILLGRPRLFGLLGREENLTIPWQEIETIGTDAVLVHTQLPSAAPSKPGLWQSLRARLGL